MWGYFRRGSLFNVTGWVWPVISWNKWGINQVLFTVMMLRCCLSRQEVSWDFLLSKKKKAPHSKNHKFSGFHCLQIYNENPLHLKPEIAMQLWERGAYNFPFCVRQFEYYLFLPCLLQEVFFAISGQHWPSLIIFPTHSLSMYCGPLWCPGVRLSHAQVLFCQTGTQTPSDQKEQEVEKEVCFGVEILAWKPGWWAKDYLHGPVSLSMK